MKKMMLTISTALVTSTSAFSATTGSLLLQGIVGQRVSITVQAEALASALNLESSQTDLKVATVTEASNSKTGYKVTITSANLGKLKRTGGAEVFSYTLKYGGSAVGLSSTAGTVFTSATPAAVSVNKDVQISYTGTPAESMVEGTYADTVTFNIAAN